MSMICVKGLQKSFGKHEVLKGIDIDFSLASVSAGCRKEKVSNWFRMTEGW